MLVMKAKKTIPSGLLETVVERLKAEFHAGGGERNSAPHGNLLLPAGGGQGDQRMAAIAR